MTDPTAPSPAARLRRQFDAGFAEPLAPSRPPSERLLLVEVGGDACAVPMAECSGVERAAGITTLPARHPAFRGLTAIGGAILPVYDLAAQLGLAGTAEHRWLVVSTGRHRVAFLVAAVEGYGEAERAAETPAGRTIVTVAGRPRRLVPLAAIVDRIAREVPAPRSEE